MEFRRADHLRSSRRTGAERARVRSHIEKARTWDETFQPNAAPQKVGNIVAIDEARRRPLRRNCAGRKQAINDEVAIPYHNRYCVRPKRKQLSILRGDLVTPMTEREQGGHVVVRHDPALLQIGTHAGGLIRRCLARR